jgi:hypothetical protein
MSYYYIDKSGQQRGPLSLDKLGKMKPGKNTMVRREGMNDWRAAGSLSGEELCECKYQIELLDEKWASGLLNYQREIPHEMVIFRYNYLGGSYAADKCTYGKSEFEIEDLNTIN